jgi:hypothetical protein
VHGTCLFCVADGNRTHCHCVNCLRSLGSFRYPVSNLERFCHNLRSRRESNPLFFPVDSRDPPIRGLTRPI